MRTDMAMLIKHTFATLNYERALKQIRLFVVCVDYLWVYKIERPVEKTLKLKIL
jgi:hypothetical protein